MTLFFVGLYAGLMHSHTLGSLNNMRLAFGICIFICIIDGLEVKRDRDFHIDWEGDRFVKDGETFQYVSGGVHYFRIPAEYWAESIRTAKSAGLNALQTYVAWNMHEPIVGQYNFKGNFDIVAFIKEVQKQDMTLIVRVGPYICGEKNFGGLPPWLLGFPGMEVRSREPAFMGATRRWLGVFLPMLRPYLYKNGGPIIMVQMENEYGAFGCDHEYMQEMYDMFHQSLGDEVVYFTTDGPGDYYCGSFNNTKVLSTIDYLEDNDKGQDTEKIFADLRKFQPHGPLVNSEYYTGWLDKWGQTHYIRTAETLGRNLNKLLAMNASVNLYMWHGGSNFGLAGDYTAITSYDYDAPVSEGGDLKLDKYWAVRNATEQRWPGKNKMPVPEMVPKLKGRTIKLKERGLITGMINEDNLVKTSDYPHKMEEIGLYEGMVAYRHVLKEPLKGAEMVVDGVHDRAYVLADNVYVKVIKRNYNTSFVISAKETLTVLVEGMGYIAWFNDGLGSYDFQYKGLENITVNGEVLADWSHYKIDVRNMVGFKEGITNKTVGEAWHYKGKPLLPMGPAAYGGSIHLSKGEVLDTFLDTTCWSKGYLAVNDVLLGRYWPDAGPQYTIYVPATYLKEGVNTITMVELQSACDRLTVRLTDTNVIDGPVDPDA